jgi:hypothetical protein
MVYKKYLKKGGKTFGPYYYESYRDGSSVKKRYIGDEKQYKTWLKKKDGKVKSKKVVEQPRLPKTNSLKSQKAFIGKLLFLLFLIGLVFIIGINIGNIVNLSSYSFTGFAVSENSSGASSSLLYADYEDEVVEQEFDTEKVDLEIKEPPKFNGEVVSKNKNERMDFETVGGNIRLYFDILNYSNFVEDVEDIVVREELEQEIIIEETEGSQEETTEDVEEEQEETNIPIAPQNVSEEDESNTDNNISEEVEEVVEESNETESDEIEEVEVDEELLVDEEAEEAVDDEVVEEEEVEEEEEQEEVVEEVAEAPITGEVIAETSGNGILTKLFGLFFRPKSLTGRVVSDLDVANADIDVTQEEIQEKAEDLTENELEEIEDEAVVDMLEEDFEVVVDEEEANDGDSDYKWGYNVKLNDLNFMAKIDVTSTEDISVWDENTLRIGNQLLSFEDLVNEGYGVRIDAPILEIELTTEEVEDNVEEEEESEEENDVSVSSTNISDEDRMGEDSPLTSHPPLEDNETNETEGDDNISVSEEVEEEDVEEELSEEEPEPTITGNMIRGLTGFVIETTELGEEEEVADLEYKNTITIYIERDFSGAASSPDEENYKIGDIVYLDPTLTTIVEATNLSTYYTTNENNVTINVTAVADSGNVSTFIDFDNSLVGWWRMEEAGWDTTSGEVKDVLGVNNGTAAGNANVTSSGYFTQGSYYDGDADYATFGDVADLNFGETQDFTISVWVKTVAGESKYAASFLSKSSNTLIGGGCTTSRVGFGFGFWPSNSQLKFMVCNSTGSTASATITASSISMGQWYHVVAQRNSSNFINLYVNGVSRGNADATGINISSANAFRMGGDGQPLYYLNGSMDDVMVFNRSLSVGEISALYADSATKYLEETYTMAAEQNYTFTAYAQDNAGNLDNSGEIIVNRDVTAPSVTINNPESNTFFNGAVNANSSSSDNLDNSLFMDYGLVSWWRMDDLNASGDPTDYVGSNDGAAVDDAAQTDSGYFGKGFSFDDDGDYVRIPDNAGLEGMDDISINFWMNPAEIETWDMILSKGCANWGAYAIYLGVSGNVHVTMLNSTLGRMPGNEHVTSSGVVVVGQWTMVTMKTNETHITFFIDGEYHNSEAWAMDTVYTGSGDLCFSNTRDAGNDRYYNGSLDDVMIFNRSLSAQEIQSMYANTSSQYLNTSITLASGEHDITFYSQDRSSNIGSTVVENITMDQTVPVVVINNPESNTFFNGNVNANSSSLDNLDNSLFMDYGLVSWWRMDDNNGSANSVSDYLGLNNGTAMYDAVQTQNGYFGKGFEFDGAGDYVDVSDNEGIRFYTNNFTIVSWFKSTGGNVNPTLFGKGDTDSGEFMFRLASTGDLNFYANGGTYNLKEGNSVFGDNLWHFGVLVRAGNITSIYLDTGTPSSATGPIVNFSTSKNVNLGCADDTAARSWNGTIDDVLIFNRSLSATEIAALYANTSSQYLNTSITLGAGEHDITFYSQDRSSNIGNTVVYNVTMDETKPVVVINNPESNTFFNGDVNANSSSSDNLDNSLFMDYGLVSWWRMDDNNGSANSVSDYLGLNNGTAMYDAVQTQNGYFGKGFEFDGDGDYVLVPQSDSLNITSNITVSSWVYLKEDQASSDGIVRKYGSGGGYLMFTYANYPYFYIGNSSGQSCEALKYTKLGQSVWKNIVGSYNGTDTLLYVDGVLWDTTACDPGFVFSGPNNNLEFGRYGGYTNGTIDDVMIWNRSLSSTEVQALYANTSSQYLNTSITLAAGEHDITFYSQDRSSNIGSTVVYNITMDQTNPVVTINNPENNTFFNGAVNANSSSSDNLDNSLFMDYGLVSWWRMDDLSGSNPTDYIGSNDGTAAGNAVQTDSGYFGKGFSFDGDGDYIAASSSFPTVNVTASMWVKRNELDEQNLLRCNGGWSIYIQNNANANKILVYNSTSGNHRGTAQLNSIDTWYHIAVVSSDSGSTIYLNGVLDPTGAGNAATNLNSCADAAPTISRNSATTAMNGTIDDVMMFNRSLTASEIQSLYANTSSQYLNTSITLDAGEHDITFYSQDRSSNIGSTVVYNVTMDQTNPVVTINNPENNTFFNGDVNANSSSSDNLDNSLFMDYGLVSWWRMDEANATHVQDYLGKHDGVIDTTATQTQNGYFGKGFYFNGADEGIAVPYSAEMNASDAYTVSLWVKRDGNSESGAQTFPFMAGVGWDGLGIELQSSVWQLWYDVNGDNDGVLIASGDTTQWTHIVAIYNQSGIYGYHNGVQKVADLTRTGSFNNLTSPIYSIGDFNNGFDFNGSIDDVAVWNRSLSSAEITALYANTSSQYLDTSITLAAGEHDITFYSQDRSSNIGSTTVYNVTMDTTAPAISFVTPANGTNTNSNSIDVNLSTNAGGDHSSFTKSGLVSWWRMDDINGSANSVSDYLGVNNGTIIGDAVRTDSGYFGKGMSFDGTGDYVKITTEDFDGLAEYSYSTWVKPVASTSLNQNFAWGGGNWIVFRTNKADQKVDYYIQTTAGGVGYTESVATLNWDSWNHVILVYNGSSANLYINGVYDTKIAQTGETPASSNYLNIGVDYNAGGGFFNGSVDDVMLFNRSLSSEEILALYGNTSSRYLNASYSGLAEGANTLTGYAQDKAGNVNSSSLIVNYDSTSPTQTISSPTNTTHTTEEIAFSVSSSESGTGSIIPNLDGSLVSWWRMDDVNGSGDVVDYLGVNNGTVVNVVQTDSGYFGKGFEFDGDGDYVEVGTGDFHTIDLISVFAWINIKDTAGTTYVASTRTSGSATGWFLRKEVGTAQVKCWLSDGAGYQVSTIGTPSTNEWAFIGCVMNGSNVIPYYNGVAGTSDSYDGTIVDGSALRIGDTPAGNGPFNGTIDDVLIFNKSLTSDEIVALYNATAISHNETLDDGSHTYTAYSQDRAANVNSSSVTFTREFGSNVTTCRTLSEANTVYTLQNDIVGITADCLVIGANNVTVDMAGYNLTSSALNANIAGISNTIPYNYTTVKNGGIYGLGLGVNQEGDFGNYTNLNITAVGDFGFFSVIYGIRVTSDSNTFSNINTSNLDDQGFFGFSTGILMSGASNNVFTDITSSSNTGFDGGSGVVLSSLSQSNTLTNVVANNQVFGIQITTSNSNTLTNITTNSNINGLTMAGGGSHILTNIIANSNNQYGIAITGNIYYNLLTNTTTNSNAGPGLYLVSAYENNFSDITVNSNYDSGIHIEQSSSNIMNNFSLYNNTLSASIRGGIYILQSSHNKFSSGTIDLTEDYGVWIKTITVESFNNYFEDITITNSGTDVFFTTGTKNAVNNTFLNVSYSSENASLAGTNSMELIRKWYYQAYVNDSLGNAVVANVSSTNSSGAVEFSVMTNSSGWVADKQEITDYYRAGFSGNGIRSYYNSVVSAVNSTYATTNSTYNATADETNVNDNIQMSIGPNVYGCGALDTENQIYTLQSDLSTDGDCLTITVSNVTVDGNGYDVIGDGDDGDYGIQTNADANLTNITIKNFGNIGNFSHGIYFDMVNNSLIYNNTMNSEVAIDTYAIYLMDGDSNIVYDNEINWNATGTSKKSYGIYLSSFVGVTAGNNNITGNALAINSALSNAYGVDSHNGGTSNSNTIQSNTFDIDGLNSYGIGFGVGGSSNTIQSNTFDIDAEYAAHGIFIDGGALGNVIFNETIDVRSAFPSESYGIWLYNVDSSNFSSCTINTTTSGGSGSAYDFYMSGRSDHNVLYDNELLGENYSVYILDAGNNNNTFVNVSYAGSESVAASSDLTRKWYYQSYVNDSNGGAVIANVSVTNSSGSVEWSVNTNASGWVASKQEVTDYVNVGGTKGYFNSVISAVNSTYATTNSSYNATADENSLSDNIQMSIGTSLSSCGWTLDQADTVYTLTADLSTTGTCLTIGANNVTVDMAGYNMTGDEGFTDYSIVSNTYNQTTIKNGYIYDFGRGILFTNNKNGVVDNMTLNSNVNGIYVGSSSNNTLSNITTNSNVGSPWDGEGIYFISSSNNTLTNIITNSNSHHGLHIEGLSENNILTNITANSNGYYGVYFETAVHNNNVTDFKIWNSSTSGSYAGIYIISGSNNTFTNGYVNDSGKYGVYINADSTTIDSSNNLFKDMWINNTDSDDVHIRVIDDSFAQNNNFTNVSYSDAEDVTSVGGGVMSLARRWYYQPNVTEYYSGSEIVGNVSVYTSLGSLQNNSLTNATGTYTNIELIDYTWNGVTKTYYSPYTINTTNATYFDESHTFNLTSSQNTVDSYDMIKSQSNVTLNSGWNLVALTFDETESGTDRNVSLVSGWNLIGYDGDVNVSLSNTTVHNGSDDYTFSNAVASNKVKNYNAYYDSSSETASARKYKFLGPSGVDDSSFRRNKGYWVYANESSNLTLPSAGGSASGQSYNWNKLRFSNGTDEKGIVDAGTAGWIPSGANNVLYYWDSGFKTICGDLDDCNSISVSSFEGVFVNSSLDNITLIRQN